MCRGYFMPRVKESRLLKVPFYMFGGVVISLK